MSKQHEALQVALEALEDYQANGAPFLKCDAAVAAIREALAEPEQKPTGIIRTIGGYPDESQHTVEWLVKHKDLHDGDKLYAAPPARKPLTDAEMRQCASAMDAEPLSEGWKELIKFARAIERAHGIGEA